jgi:hypothetical protein
VPGLDGATVIHSSLEQYIHAALKELPMSNKKLQGLEGELREGVDGLAAVLSARPRQKQLFWACNHLLQHWAEPMSAIALVVAGHTYEAERIEQGWLKLLESMPHDSAAGCVVDSVADEVTLRLQRCVQSAGQLTSEIFQKVISHIDFRPHKSAQAFVVAFNTLSWRRSNSLVVAEIVLPKRLGAHLRSEIQDIATGIVVPSTIVAQPREVWDFVLPDYEFRKHFLVQRLFVAFVAPVSSLGWSTFSVSLSQEDGEPIAGPSKAD